MSYRNAGRRRQTKGIVLFTVVAIMLFLLIMVMSTLSVVSSAQRRTYTKFKENQAYFTARSGIASFLRAGSAGPSETALVGFHDEFLDLCQNGNVYNDTGKSFDDMEGSSDVMKVTVEFPQPPQSGGDLKYLYGSCKIYVYKTGVDKAKIVSRAAIGGFDSGEPESVVTLYISVPTPKPELFKNAMTSFANVTNSTVGILGGMGAYVDPANGSKASSDKAEASTMTYVNNGFVSRNVVIGSGATLHTQAEFVFQDVVGKLKSDGTYEASEPQYMGLTVMGDAKFTDMFTVYGDSTSKTPYVYVDGNLAISTGTKIGADFDSGSISDSADNAVNVYCNTINISNTPTINGDLYIYGESQDTDYAYMTSAGADTTANSIAGGTYYGDIYCNGDLVLGAGGQTPTIEGDVYCTGTLTVNSANINGTLYAAAYAGSNPVLADATIAQVYSDMPSDFIEKDYVKENIIANPGSQFDNFVGVTQDNQPVAGTMYPALGYYTDDSGNWVERTTVDSSWSIWNPYDYFQMNDSGKVAYIDATENSLNIVVPNGFFPTNTQNNKIVIKGDKRVDFYIVEHTPNPWVWNDDTTYTSSSNQNSARNNMVITEDFYRALTNGDQIHIACPGATDNISLNVYYNIQDGMTYNIEGDLLMGYIYGPNAVVNMNNGVSIDNINYDGTSYGTVSNMQFIGSCVTSNITTSNSVQGIFLPPAKANNSGENKFWEDLYYLNY
ncbi:MAG: hypothetical protein J5999_11655 [Oscillospiraceae bacterium]|nr:hypothetical protein [Oscillospiraceae bacterium]